jgi:hypothetical protein
MNVFEERVFDDTAYAVCSIQFSRKTEAETETETEPIRVHVSVPENDERGTDARNNYHRRRNLQPAPTTRIRSASHETRKENDILLKCIDDSIDSQLGFRVADARWRNG